MNRQASLILFNGGEFEFSAIITDMTKTKTVLKILSKTKVIKESSLHLTIAQGIPKGQKMDDMIPKLTELGIQTLIPLITERGMVRKVSTEKINRWQKIAIQSSQQTGRTQVPHITEPLSFHDFLQKYEHKEKILFYELESAHSFKAALEKIKGSEIYFVIGPEGGFSPEEIKWALEKKCHVVSLGKRILRTETVAPAVTAIAQYDRGDINKPNR